MKIKNICALNVNSITSLHRKQLFYNFIDDNHSDIIFLSETCLKPEISFHVNGYNIFRQDRIGHNGGGTAILLNEKIKFRNLRRYSSQIEATKIEVFLNNIWICLISVYIPPYNTSTTYNLPITTNALETVLNSNLPIICGGDFNARLIEAGEPSYNFNGRILSNLL